MVGVQPLRIVGRYELHRELAAGGMATVHLGRSIGAAGFAKSVAIKRLHSQFARDPEFVAMLLEEARLSERIRHPNVVATLDVVAAEHELLLVMEYVHGETLARLLRSCAETGERCPPEIAATIAHAVLLGLHAAHTASDAEGAPLCIIHRDVSPQNIIVGADGVARLLDFGIAKAAGAASHTRAGEVKGKVPYMAPEILRLEPASPRSDIYGVAVTLWESLCARRLFRGDSEVGVWASVLETVVPLPSTIVGPLGPLEDVVMRGLSRDASERFLTALAMAQALESTIKLASAADVAAWVALRAAESLATLSAVVRAIERSAPSSPDASAQPRHPQPPPARPSMPVTATPVMPLQVQQVQLTAAAPVSGMPVSGMPVSGMPVSGIPVSARSAPSRSQTWGPAVLFALIALSVITVALVFGRGALARMKQKDAPTQVVAPADEARAPTAAQPPASASGIAAAGDPTPTPTPATEPAEVASARPPRRPGAGRPADGPRGAASARPRASQDPCDPPYVLDEAGRKHFKLSCLN
jgi:serine/threonine-protein kinase